jgi:hypothetical protein
MSSNAKRRQTLAKRRREEAVKERRAKKNEKKEARKQAAAEASSEPGDERTDAIPNGPYAALLARLELSADEVERLTDEEIMLRAVDAGMSRLTAERILVLERGSDDAARARPHGQSRPWTARGS